MRELLALISDHLIERGCITSRPCLLPTPGWQIDLNLHPWHSDDLLHDSDKLNPGSPCTGG